MDEHTESPAKAAIASVLIWATCAAALIFCLSGCTITTKNQGECGLRYGTEITFFHRAAQTAQEPATIQSSVPPLEEYIHKKNEQIGQPQPVSTNP